MSVEEEINHFIERLKNKEAINYADFFQTLKDYDLDSQYHEPFECFIEAATSKDNLGYYGLLFAMEFAAYIATLIVVDDLIPALAKIKPSKMLTLFTGLVLGSAAFAINNYYSS